jgi:hypothetical protein
MVKPITAETDSAVPAPGRAVGVLAIFSGIAALVLLANHPADSAHSFAEVLKSEAANRFADNLVHGGFVVVLALQGICYAILTQRLGWTRPVALAGFVFFAVGAMFLSGSMVIDGFVSPAVAARYLQAPDKLEYARSLFVLIGTMISVLMPMGLLFQSATIAAWSWVLIESGRRAAGSLALIVSALAIVALVASFVQLNPLVLMGAVAETSMWSLLAGYLLLRAI